MDIVIERVGVIELRTRRAEGQRLSALLLCGR